jgi:DNA polymerase-3 subunit beta
VNRIDLINALRVVSVTENRATKMARLKGGEELIVSSKDPDYATFSSVKLKLSKEGGDMEIGLKSEFLAQLLATIKSQRVLFFIQDTNRAVVVKPETEQGYKMLIMPMMLCE